jgi:choline dehydrogenase-like flavoprotein
MGCDHRNETVDFVVVGSGAAGGVIARELSQAGLTVLVFEQGPRLSPADFEHDELKYWFLSGITSDPISSPQTFRKTPADAAKLPHGPNPLEYARLVGGSSNHYTANFWRFHEIDFHERSVYGGIPGTAFADWPISYRELEPYYTKVEWEVGVSGLANASPFDPPRSKPYPMPPMPVKSSGVLMEAERANSGCILSLRRWPSRRSPTAAGLPACTADSAWGSAVKCVRSLRRCSR